MSNALLEILESPAAAEPTRQTPEPPRAGTALIEAFVHDQQDLTAVQRFEQLSASATEPLQARYYRDLIPLSAPPPGSQYAFEVDLDACTSCKSCVTACHNLNGLDAHETWRSVGQIVSGNPALPLIKTVTASCHHCAHPACMDGCPANAFEKNRFTGIVQHLDDQCIGCQYCVLKCPYDAPKFSPERGIIRKCDMCSSRLAVNEAPACVQACPSQAIRITTVKVTDIQKRAHTNSFLPAAPAPDYAQPSTLYRTRTELPESMVAGDDSELTPQPAHLSLVWTLVLTQFGAGAMFAAAILQGFVSAAAARWMMTAGFVQFIVGMHCALLHLGRPMLAYRAVLGLRHSWLSREVVVFGGVAAVSGTALASHWFSSTQYPALTTASAMMSVVAVFCSVMIYADTRRSFWSFSRTATRFFLSTLSAAALAVLVASAFEPAADGASAAAVACILCASKLAVEAAFFRHLKPGALSLEKKTALLMTGPLVTATRLRFAAGIVGGMLLPLGYILYPDGAVELSMVAAVVWMCGELLERSLFFRAVVPLKMPGAMTP